MKQKEIVVEFIAVLHEAEELDYIEHVLMAAAKTEAVKRFIREAFRLERARRPLLLEMKGGLTA